MLCAPPPPPIMPFVRVRPPYSVCSYKSVFRIPDGVDPDRQIRTTLDYGSGSCSILQWLSRWQQKTKKSFFQSWFAYYLPTDQRIDIHISMACDRLLHIVIYKGKTATLLEQRKLVPIDDDAVHNQVNEQVLVGTFTSVAKGNKSQKRRLLLFDGRIRIRIYNCWSGFGRPKQ